MIEEDENCRSLLWGLFTDFFISDSLKPRLSLKTGQASFVLISFNPDKQLKFFTFKSINDTADFRLYNFGNIHSTEGDLEGSEGNIQINLRQLKRKSKIETIPELLKFSSTKPIADILGEDVRQPWSDNRLPEGRRLADAYLNTKHKAAGSNPHTRLQLNDLIGSDKLPDFADFETDSRDPKDGGKQISPEYLEQLLMRQEKMLQTVIDLLQQRGNSPNGDPRSTVKSNQQTVSIGTNTTMRANELQQFMGEACFDDQQNNSIGFNSSDPFTGAPAPKKKIISVGPDRNSLSRTLSGMPKSDNESKSSRRLKDKDDTQPSPGDDTQSEKRMQANRIRHYVDDSISIRSSNVNQLESSSIQIGKHLDKLHHPKHDSSLNYGSLGLYQKPVTPPIQAHHKRPDFHQPYSPQFTTHERLQFGRATDSGLTRGTNTESPLEDLRLNKGSSYQESVQSRETRTANRKAQPLGQPNFHNFREEGSTSKMANRLDSFQEDRGLRENPHSWMDRPKNSDQNSKLSILQELEANTKACEFDQGGGKATFEIPRICGDFKDYDMHESDDEETRKIQHHYKISK